MKRSIALVALVLIAVTTIVSVAHGVREEIVLTTIIPDQQVLMVKKGVVGYNYRRACAKDPDNYVKDSNLLIEGNVGIGTTAPNSEKGTSGYLDAKDVYLSDAGKWASEVGEVSSAQAVNTSAVDLATLNTWYEVVKIEDFVCDGKDILINAVAVTDVTDGNNPGNNGLFECRLLIGGVEKTRVHISLPQCTASSLPITWLEKSCSGTKDLVIEVRAVHSASVGIDCNSVTFPSVINVIRLP